MSATRLATPPTEKRPPKQQSLQREQVFDAFRRWGYLQAQLDPLDQYLSPVHLPELDITGSDAADARRIYASTTGAEFMHIHDADRREWIAERLESGPPVLDAETQQRVLDMLTRADTFEQVIQSRYLGTKRFSLEGVTALLPFLDELLHRSADLGVQTCVMAMSHRGRLSVMVNTLGKPAADIFSKFEDVNPRSILGGGDVKYHVGATGIFHARNDEWIALHLVSNPSHLEAVDPVAMGRARAKQTRWGADGIERVLPVTIHGDAAFAGQGIWAETLNLAEVEGFSVGGSIHIIVNNLIGFTAEPDESASTRFASDLAHRLPIPIFHVNAEDPAAIVRIAALAAEYRSTFHSDVVIDLIGYRRHGHSEVDDPTITQPLRYSRIKNHPPLSELYAKQLGIDISTRVRELQSEFAEAQKAATAMQKMPHLARLPEYWSSFKGGPWKPEYEVETGLTREQIEKISAGLVSYPQTFHIHPKIKKLLEQRDEMGQGKRPFDYGMAEAVAFGSLLISGTPIRFSGQDSQRGTFNQRHSVLIDIENEQPWIPLCNLASDQAPFDIYNSILSEAGVLGFEYGYSRDYPETLVLWEAQFGDFANGAQVVIDQFISAGEDKWGLLSGLVLLLPHGYEGQGPEHSSARLERFLQLAAEGNIRVANCTTPAQYFHLLRRQARRTRQRPLIIMTPKSLLRHPQATSKLEDLTTGTFQPVIDDLSIDPKGMTRILLCSGKIYYDLRAEAGTAKDRPAIVRMEQLYSLPEIELRSMLERYPDLTDVVWVQEEPRNMGAWRFLAEKLRAIFKPGVKLSYIGRPERASPAEGYPAAHAAEQKRIVKEALSGGR